MPKPERESDIERYFDHRVKETGGETRKMRWIGRAHAPDRFAFWPSLHELAARGAFVELKRPGEPPRSGQVRERDRLWRAGFDALIIDSREAVDRLVALYGLSPLELAYNKENENAKSV